MNPVDHVRHTIRGTQLFRLLTRRSLTVVVTINISVKLRPFLATLHKVKRLVSLLLGGRVYSVEHRRRRIERRGIEDSFLRGICGDLSGLAAVLRTSFHRRLCILGINEDGVPSVHLLLCHLNM
jgi:hypothetical protein